jgi:GNAT superfamily N-acetyltransferase
MHVILDDFSPAMLARANEENLLSWLPIFGRLEGAQVNDIPGMNRSITNIPMSLFNSIMDARLEPENVEPVIAHITADAQSRNVPVLWWVGPSTRPVDLATRLISHGFEIDEDGPGMAADLDQLNEGLPVPAGLTIKMANDSASQLVWCHTMALGFEAPPPRVEFAVKHWSYLLSQLDPEITQPYITWLNGQPVSTSLMQLGGGVAGIYSVATIPEARRKGIGAQVTLYPLQQARLRGYKVGILQASPMGLPVYRSLGFQEYCRITSYVWRAAQPEVKSNAGG